MNSLIHGPDAFISLEVKLNGLDILCVSCFCIILFASDNIHISKATEAWSGCLDLANLLNASNNVQQISNRDHLFYSLLSFIQGSTLLGPFQHCSTLCESVLPTYKNANLSNHQLLGVCKPVAILFELVQTMQK